MLEKIDQPIKKYAFMETEIPFPRCFEDPVTGFCLPQDQFSPYPL
jgi:hypothetical protein